MPRISHPDIPGSAVDVTQEAFDVAWAPLGWELADDEVDVDPPAAPLAPLPNEDQIPDEELAGQQPPPRNASNDRISRFLVAAGVPHDPAAKRKDLVAALDAAFPRQTD